MTELASAYLMLTALMAMIFIGSGIVLTLQDPHRWFSHLVAAVVCSIFWPYFAWRISRNVYLELARGRPNG